MVNFLSVSWSSDISGSTFQCLPLARILRYCCKHFQAFLLHLFKHIHSENPELFQLSAPFLHPKNPIKSNKIPPFFHGFHRFHGFLGLQGAATPWIPSIAAAAATVATPTGRRPRPTRASRSGRSCGGTAKNPATSNLQRFWDGISWVFINHCIIVIYTCHVSTISYHIPKYCCHLVGG